MFRALRPSRWLCALAFPSLLLLLPAPSLAQPDATVPTEAGMSVKVSTSRDDANLQHTDSKAEGDLEFFVFVDGGMTRGGEFGLAIDGAEFVSFLIDTEQAWMTLPMANPYPGTIAQAIAGPYCSDAPTYFGKLTVTPNERGGRVVVDVIPSLRSDQAVLLNCDNEPIAQLRAFPATVNGGGKNARNHGVRGDVEARDEGPDPNVIRNEEGIKNEMRMRREALEREGVGG
ncbi:MAG: hypothetical protein DHS20C21_20830 [Gemmatimonadota bacterium]|nr:MAG: hypothetical protein DHS20C21_20830 [Gemmatimonadota bacterium]